MATEFTPHYNLDKYTATDKPNLRDQYNAAMDKIDDALFSANTNATEAKNATTNFQAQLTQLNTAIGEETETRQNADTSLASDIADNAAAISAETTARQNADTSLASDIADNAAAISAETTARQNADTSLASGIADNAAAISAETTARQNADTALDNDIDAINISLSNLNSIIPSSEFSTNNTVKNYIDENVEASKGNVLKYGGSTETYNLDWYQIFKDCFENDHGIYFPSGVYYIDSRIVLDTETFCVDGLPFPIRGDGAILKFSGSTSAIVNNASKGNGYCSVSGLVFSDENLSVQNALVNNLSNGMRVNNCHFIGFDVAIKSTAIGLFVSNCVFDGTPWSATQGYGNPRGIAISCTSDSVITGCKAFWLEMFVEGRQNITITNNYFYSPGNSITTYFAGHRTDHIYASVISNNEIDTPCVCVLNAYTNVIFTNNLILWDATLQNRTAYIFATNNNQNAYNLVFSENSISEPVSEVWTVAQWGLLDGATSLKLRSYTSRDNRIFQRTKPENGTTRKFKLFCGINSASFYFDADKYFKITPICTDNGIYRFWPVTVPSMVIGGDTNLDNSAAWFTVLSIARYYKDDADAKSPAGYTNIAMNSIGSLTYSGAACYYEETGFSTNTVVTTVPAGYSLRANRHITWNTLTPTP